MSSNSQDRRFGTIGKGFALIGVALLAGAAYYAQDTIAFVRRAARIQGEVVSVVRVDGATGKLRRSSRGSAWYPVIAYTPEGGALITKRSNIGSSPPSYSQGEKIHVLYDPAEPEQFQIDDPVAIWMGTFVFTFIGALITLIGGLFVWLARRASAGKSTTPQ